jgi:hypothetical protein
MLESLIKEFHQKITYDRVNSSRIYQDDLERLYKAIIEGLSLDYTTYRKYVAMFLSSLETNNSVAVPFAIHLFMGLQSQVVQSKHYRPFDLSIMTFEAEMETVDKYRDILADSLSKNNQPRISDTTLDLSIVTEDERKKLASLIIHKLQEDGKQLHWSKDFVENTLLNFVVLRQLLTALDNVELFYHAVGIFFDRLSSSEYFQAARDIAEEINISAFKDEVPEFGFFNSFRLYSNLNSIHAALMYANLSLVCAIRKGGPYSEKYAKEIIWQGIKFFRNVELFPWAAELYNSIPQEINFLDYERRSLDHSYFSGLLSGLDADLPSSMMDYLNKEREDILSGGINEVVPWLLTLYNIRRLYPKADFSPTGFGFYLSVFETIVPSETVQKYKAIIEGDSPDLKDYLKESLIKLNETRNATDFVYDNESAIKISNRLIEYCIDNKDSAGFLLSMLLKSDYSILFKQKESKVLAPLMLPEINIDTLDILYEDDESFFNALSLYKNIGIVWLAFSEGKLFELSLINNTYSFHSLTHWSNAEYRSLINSDYLVDFSFEDTVIKGGSKREKSPEEFTAEEKQIASKLANQKLDIPMEVESIFLVKDMEISKYPHNLYLNMAGEFISKQMPVTNILSTEWFLATRKDAPIKKDYTKSIWIPTDSGDMALNYLYDKIEDTLNDNSFEIHRGITLTSPLSADINIICSHGGKNISETQILSQKTSYTYELNDVIGKGKILIFFVCYSGSMKTEFFRNNVTSLVKRFIANGYDAVIAPFWALEVTIPHYWLPEFLRSLDAGLPIDVAVFKANKKVYDRYPTPAAWACLHLYGNPTLKVI